MSASSTWVQIFESRDDPPLRLVCFPFAGGGAQSFRAWPAQLPVAVELCAVQLPGREMRLREAPFSDTGALVRALVPALLPYLDKPFVLFGHSMGALIAYEAARLLHAQSGLTPQRLIVSARVAPHCSLLRAPINRLPQAEFMEGLRNLNGTPAEVLQDDSLMTLIAPMLRADLAIHEEYSHQPGPALPCDVLAFGGLRDPEAGRAGLNAWREVTAGSFALRMLPGDHFFIQSAQNVFLRMLSIELNRLIADLPAAAA